MYHSGSFNGGSSLFTRSKLVVPPPLALLLALLGISSAAPLARLANVDGVTAATWRLSIGAIVTFLLLVAKRQRMPGFSDLTKAATSGLFLAAHLALWLESLRHMSVASSTGIVVSYPVITALYEVLRGEVKKPGKVLFGVVLGFLGVLVLSTPWAGATLYGALLSFSAAVMASAYFIFGRRLRVSGLTTLQYTLVAYGSAALALLLLSLIFGVAFWEPPRKSIPYLVMLGLIPMLLGHSMLNYALAFYPASVVTIVALLEPYGASLLAWLVLGEEPKVLTVLGMVLSVSGAWTTIRNT